MKAIFKFIDSPSSLVMIFDTFIPNQWIDILLYIFIEHVYLQSALIVFLKGHSVFFCNVCSSRE